MKLSNEIKMKIVTALSVAAFLVTTLCIFGPSKIYLTNALEFDFLYSQMLLYLMPVALIFIVVLTLLLILLPAGLYSRAVAVLCAAGVCLWLQGNMLVWNYGMLDGKPINWDGKIIYGVVDISVWILAISIAIVKSEWIKKNVKTVSAFFIIVQIIATFLLLAKQPDIATFKQYSINIDDKFTFSKNKNVMVLILDGFQTDVFQEILDENGAYAGIFEGFTYFRNALSGYPTTAASIPNILTSRMYDNSEKYESFLKTAYISNTSIPAVLKKNGFQVDIYPLVPKTIYFDERVASNLIKKDFTAYSRNIYLIYAITAFRYSPNFIKRMIYSNASLFSRMVFPNALDKNVAVNFRLLSFISEMTSQMKLGYAGNVFKFYHTRFPHPPLEINENLNGEQMEFNRTNFKRQAKATLEMVRRFLAALKKIGAYDNTMICIVADHGLGLTGFHGQRSVDQKLPVITNYKQAGGLPLILAKKIGSKNGLTISDAPVCLADIPATIFHEMGIKNDAPGKSIFQIIESEQRNRKYYFYEWKGNWYDEYFPQMKEFIVSGHSWSPTSWKNTHRTFAANKILQNKPAYKLGDPIQFNRNGNADPYKLFGWGSPEEKFTWTVGNKARLVIPFKKSDKPVILRVYQKAFIVPGKLDKQQVNIYINNEKAGEWQVAGEGSYSILIPQRYLSDTEIDITFELTDAAAPKRLLSDSNDERMLGVGVKSLVLEELPAYRFGELIKFGNGGTAGMFQGKGWGVPEKDFTWTKEKRAHLLIPVKEVKSSLVLKLQQRPFIVKGKLDRQQVNVLVNGKEVGEWVISSEGECRMIVPQNFITDTILNVVFEMPDARMPKGLIPGNNDERILGIGVKSMVLEEIPAYCYGDIIKFGQGGNAEQYQGIGWSIPETGFTWTDGSEAVLYLPVKKPSGDLQLTMIQEPFLIKNKIKKQTVIVYVNDKKAGMWPVTDAGKRIITLPEHYIHNKLIKLHFKLPDACSPGDVQSDTQDRRRLGLAVKSMLIEEK